MHCSHYNQKVEFHNHDKKINGTFKGINKKGYAMIQINNKIEKFSSGVIEL